MDRGRTQTRWARWAGLGAVALATVVAVVVTLGEPSHAADRQKAASRGCRSLPAGSSERAAERVVQRFVRVAVVNAPSACDTSTLTLPGLAHPRYPTGAPGKVVGWWQLAPRVTNAKGLWEYAGFLWLDAPDAAPAAFEFLLELHGKRWLVSSFAVAPGDSEVDLAKAPT
jgi:hypothetical protein